MTDIILFIIFVGLGYVILNALYNIYYTHRNYKLREYFFTSVEQMPSDMFDEYLVTDLMWMCEKLGPGHYKMYAVPYDKLGEPDAPIKGFTHICRTVNGKIETWYV